MEHVISLKQLTRLFDAKLTPASAKKWGYVYIDDIRVSPEENIHSTHLFLTILADHQLKLGVPQSQTQYQFGLYIPQKELQKVVNYN